MVRPPSFDLYGIKSGVWSKEEDDRLRAFIQKHGHRNWQKLPSLAGLARSGKSCRLRWMNYLQPGLKKGNFTKDEVDLIIKLHNQIGNRWSAIAEKLPGRTDNDIKNHWHAHIKKRSHFVTRAEEQSFDEMNCCKESNDEEEQNAVEDSNVGGLWAEEYDDGLMFKDLGLLSYNYNEFNIEDLMTEEEFCTLGLLHNHSPTFSDSSSDTGSRIDMDIPPFPFPAQEEFCDYHTPTFYDSSEPEINIPPQDFSALGAFSTPSEYSTLNNQREVFIGFNHLERAWYFGDDDVDV